MKSLRIALLAGGVSAEREVSLKTGAMIRAALSGRHKIYFYDPKKDLIKFIRAAQTKKFQIVIPALHGFFGEDGRLQGLLDYLQIPYLFSGVLASAVAMDKQQTKILARRCGLRTAASLVINRHTSQARAQARRFPRPFVCKPLTAGSSKGVAVVRKPSEISAALDRAWEQDERIMLEKYIPGRELTATVMTIDGQDSALPIVEIIPKISKWFDYEAKYQAAGSEEICPAKIPASVAAKIKKQTIKLFSVLGLCDLARADFIWPGQGTPYFLEINTIPGMTATSLAPQAARAAGYVFVDFLECLIENCLKRFAAR